MKVVDIQFPEECSLEGWNRHVFMRRIRSALNGSYFSVCGLDQCRTALAGQNDPGNEKLQDELRAFHCVAYKDMAPEESAILAEKVAEFVGVGLKVRPAAQQRMRPVLVGCFVVAALAVGAFFGLSAVNARPGSTPVAVDEADMLGKLRAERLIQEQSAAVPRKRIAANHDSLDPIDPVMTLTMNTNEPRNALRSAAALAARDKAQYTVIVSISPAGAAAGVVDRPGQKADETTQPPTRDAR